MSAAAVVLNLLGLAPQFEQASTIISATRTGVEAINAMKELLTSEEGEKFKEHMIELLGGTKEVKPGVVKIDVAKGEPEVAHGHYIWDSLQGWVWVPKED